MQRTYRILMLKFLLFYICIMLFGVSILTLSNIFVLGWNLESLLQFNIVALLGEGVCGTLILQGVTMAGLRHTRKLFQGTTDKEEKYRAWTELVQFPSRIFRGMAIFGVAASILYHSGEMLFTGDKLGSIILPLIPTVLFEQTLSLILALLFFTGGRHLLRPYIRSILPDYIQEFRKTTFYNNLLMIFCCLLIVIIYSTLWYILDRTLGKKVVSVRFIVYLSLFDLGFGVAIFTFFIRELKYDFGLLIDAMLSLLNGSRHRLKDKLPILSNDEIGNLGLIFNRLQEKVSKEYDEIDEDLKLAGNIQQRLLPEGEKSFGGYTVIGVCKPCREVGGDFFDIVPLEEEKFAVIIGDVVGKGMPAALIMSAILLLCRTEMQRGSELAEVFRQLNKSVLELKMKDICLTLGIAVFDMHAKVMHYGSAGHVSPYQLKATGVSELACSSLPLGIDAFECYDTIECSIEGNDRFIFYTDGVVDSFTLEDGTLSGFDSFKKILVSLENKPSIIQQRDEILSLLQESNAALHDDDKTFIIVKYNGE